MSSAINWDTTKEDTELIQKIAERATILYGANGVIVDSTAIRMDITACHLNGTPLRLQELLQSTDFSFAHDISGINLAIDRNSGLLTRGFRPRFAKPVHTAKTEAL